MSHVLTYTHPQQTIECCCHCCNLFEHPYLCVCVVFVACIFFSLSLSLYMCILLLDVLKVLNDCHVLKLMGLYNCVSVKLVLQFAKLFTKLCSDTLYDKSTSIALTHSHFDALKKNYTDTNAHIIHVISPSHHITSNKMILSILFTIYPFAFNSLFGALPFFQLCFLFWTKHSLTAT